MGSILVIDDEKMVSNFIEIALSAFGHHIEIAEDGSEGIRKFDEGIYDLVITDLIMPKVDGNGVIDHIRHSERNQTPIIGISGTPRALKNSGADSVLAKPFPLQTLLKTVEHLAAFVAI